MMSTDGREDGNEGPNLRPDGRIGDQLIYDRIRSLLNYSTEQIMREGPKQVLRSIREMSPGLLTDLVAPVAIELLDLAVTRDTLKTRCQADNRLWYLDEYENASESVRHPTEITAEVTCSGNKRDPFTPELTSNTPSSDGRQFVCELSEARVVGTEPVATTTDGRIVVETIINTRANNTRLSDAIGTITRRQGVHWAFETFVRGKRPQTPREFDTACLLTNPWTNYYHFTVEHLPKLRAIEWYQKKTGRDPTLILPSEPPSWMWDLLRILGVDLDNCIPWDGSYAEVERLIVPSHPSRDPTPATCRWLRDQVFDGISDRHGSRDGERIFVSRRKADDRDVLNEEAVMEVLKEYGFQRYVLEDMPVAEQALLFDAADAVVAPHGAGLTNIIYSRDICVIELSPIDPAYVIIADRLDHEYCCLNCDWVGSDLRVDTDELCRVLDQRIRFTD
jgi:hypothetical protein